MTRLIAVRHGETEWNKVGRQQGHLDSPLTPRGIEQAELIAEGLSRSAVEFIYSSDLGRACATAKIIGHRLGMPAGTDARLRERHLGILQGLTMAEFAAAYPVDARAFESGDPDYVIPGGESACERAARSVECADDLARRHDGCTVLLVAHGGTLRSYFHRAIGLPLTVGRHFSLVNGALNAFTIDNGDWRLETWGDVCYLGNVAALDDT